MQTQSASDLTFAAILDDDAQIKGLEIFKERRAGYGVVCALVNDSAGRDNNFDPAYRAITQTLGAAKGRVSAGPNYGYTFRYVFPTVVLSAPLFEAYLDNDGDVKVEARDEMSLLWRNPELGVRDSVVHIVTEDRLPAFIQRLFDAFAVLSACEKQMLYAIDIAQRRASRAE